MAKTTTAGMDTHLQSEVTSLAMAVVIERTDGVRFRLTTSSEDIRIDIGDGDGEQVYSASEGVSRTNISNDAELNVDNLDVVGIFDNTLLKETELRRGLFDFAEFKIFVFNHQDLSDGIIKIFRGELGEVITTHLGFFRVTVRSIVQVYSKETGEHYSKDCRADLGDERCLVPIFPDVISRGLEVNAGEFYRASPALESVAVSTMLVHGENNAEDTGTYGGTPTFGAQAALNTTTVQFGPASIEFSPSGPVNPSEAFVSYPDNNVLTIGANEFTIEMWVRFKDLTSSLQLFASHYNNSSNQRAWTFSRNGGSIAAFFSDDGTSAAPALTISGTFTPGWAIDTWYHVAVTRDSGNDVRLFVDGVQYGATTPVTFAIHNSTAPLWLGKFRSTGFDDSPLNGFIEDFRFTIGAAIYTANFTPPGRHQSIAEVVEGLIWEDFQDRIYQVTTAGTTDPVVQPAYDTTVGNDTTDGSAVLTAHHSWMRFAQVASVDGASTRRIFTVSELTPSSGQAVGPESTPTALGFPDDWFNGGGAFFETGDNAGRVKEVRDFEADNGLFLSPVIMNFEGADAATSGPGFVNDGFAGDPTQIVGDSQIDTAQVPAGGDSTSSLLLDGVGDYLRWVDSTSFNLGTGQVTIQSHFRLSATGAFQTIASQFDGAGFDQRGWFLRVNNTDVLQFTVFQNGTGTVAADLVGTTVLTTGVNHHVAVVRKANGDWQMFLDGVTEAGPVTPTANPFNSTADFRIGALEAGGITQFWNGWIDSLELRIGNARWESDFTPPTGNVSDPLVQTIELWEDLPFDIQVGDKLRIFPGCNKTLDTCITKFNNAINFVGEPFVPGEDILGQYPDAR